MGLKENMMGSMMSMMGNMSKTSEMAAQMNCKAYCCRLSGRWF